MRLIKYSITTIFLALLVIAGLAAYMLYAPVALPKEGAVVYVRPGISRENLVMELSQARLIRLAPLFEIYAYLYGVTPRSGEFLVAQGSTPFTIWKQLTKGSVRYYRAFTIVPGWTFRQVRDALNNNPMIRHVSANMNNENIMAALGDASHQPEGMFLPETYYYSRGDVDLVLLKRAHELMTRKLNEAWENRAANLPYQSSYEVLIAASLIEKEAYLAKEQPIIGGVLVNRLRKKMLLQFDPTVIYGMGEAYQGKIYKKDLTTDTPYNTYVHTGLTPTPIAMPGAGAIRAAVHPENHDYLYFVAKGDGSHEFTTNLTAHHDAVKKAADVHTQQTVSAGESHASR